MRLLTFLCCMSITRWVAPVGCFEPTGVPWHKRLNHGGLLIRSPPIESGHPRCDPTRTILSSSSESSNNSFYDSESAAPDGVYLIHSGSNASNSSAAKDSSGHIHSTSSESGNELVYSTKGMPGNLVGVDLTSSDWTISEDGKTWTRAWNSSKPAA